MLLDAGDRLSRGLAFEEGVKKLPSRGARGERRALECFHLDTRAKDANVAGRSLGRNARHHATDGKQPGHMDFGPVVHFLGISIRRQRAVFSTRNAAVDKRSKVPVGAKKERFTHRPSAFFWGLLMDVRSQTSVGAHDMMRTKVLTKDRQTWLRHTGLEARLDACSPQRGCE